MEKLKPRLGSAVLVEHDGKYLLGERNKENYNGYWVIPGGGVKFGETLEQAAIREIKEETNLDVEIVKLIAYKEIINVPGKYHSVVFFYLAKPKHTKIEAREDILKAKFFSISEMKNLQIAESAVWVFKELGVWD